ncbi:ParB N-terminal domain-containing protein [Rhodobacterales bacterium HKCCE3408]|nr:ParB N-terminal domain-containing protein [Rhodobacterales bacterium HKCCE3408]
MAKRRRLSPVTALGAETGATPDTSPARPARAPIADLAGAASARSALDEVTGELTRARAEGRMIVALPLDAVEAGHLIRDRIAAADDELAALKASIAARGQQVPVEVTDLGDGRYGLISGWRRLTALGQLRDETGEERFGSVLALLRRPDSAGEAYLAMVEENEIRVGLSHYERARVAARASEAGVFPDTAAAIRTLFASASKAKRSKIASFVTLYEELDSHLAYPAAIGERLGLKLAQAIAEGRAGDIRAALMLAAAPDAAAEQTALARAATRPKPGEPKPGRSAPEVVPGIRMARSRSGITLTGPGVDGALLEEIESFLKRRYG